MRLSNSVAVITWLLFVLNCVHCLPGRGQWDFQFNSNYRLYSVPKPVFGGTQVFVQITCEDPLDVELSINWSITETKCWEDFRDYYVNEVYRYGNRIVSYVEAKPFREKCSAGAHIPIFEQKMRYLPPMKQRRSDRAEIAAADEREPKVVTDKLTPQKRTNNLVYTFPHDGIFLFALSINSTTSSNYSVEAHVRIISDYGYLSAVDWPLLPFYGAMCLVYVAFGLIWLIVSFAQWRDLLRIQFWIGGVILLGMLEKAMFYAEYQSINSTGNPVKAAILIAEWVSCAKRTLARMLVIIVSLGFGIVKPRLGPMLHRVVGTGTLYFGLACVESYLRVKHVQNGTANEIVVASIPLAVLDSAICWWIFTSLVQTTRTLRLRRNMVKLSLYRHFTNTLIFAVIASIIFMLFSIKVHRIADCLSEWKDIWQDEAFWHVLFSLLLLVIMILWRPTNNNQRYAFTPLLDNPEDEDDDDDEEEQFVADVYGVKMRSNRNLLPKGNNTTKATTNEEDDLRWVEEHIPMAIADAALPVLDSDEEIVNTRFEVSKMQ